MAEQKLTDPDIAGSLKHKRNLSTPDAVGAICRRIEPSKDNPSINEPAVLPCCDVIAGVASALEEPITRSRAALFQPNREDVPCRIGEFERHSPAGLLLHHHGP